MARPAPAEPEDAKAAKRPKTLKPGDGQGPGWDAAESRKRTTTLAKLWMFFGCLQEASDLWEQVEQEQDEEKHLEIWRDTCFSRATGTLSKRAGSIAAYVKWYAAARPEQGVSIREMDVYTYVKVLEAEGAAPTKADAFVSSIRFAHGLFGIRTQITNMVSVRAAGSAAAQMLLKRPTRQMHPLRATLVVFLERVVCSDPDTRRVILAGHILFLVHTRNRHMDAVRITVEPFLDESEGYGFIETSTRSELTKGGSKQRRGDPQYLW